MNEGSHNWPYGVLFLSIGIRTWISVSVLWYQLPDYSVLFYPQLNVQSGMAKLNLGTTSINLKRWQLHPERLQVSQPD